MRRASSSGSRREERRLQVCGESLEGRRCRCADRAANGILDAEPILARDRDAGVGAQGVHDDGEKDFLEPRVVALRLHARARSPPASTGRWVGAASSVDGVGWIRFTAHTSRAARRPPVASRRGRGPR